LLSFDDMAAVLAGLTDRPIRRIEISDVEQGQQFARMGLPQYAVHGLVETFALIRAGRFAYLSQDVCTVTGRPPNTFETWARAHLSDFNLIASERKATEA
jgi:hypothetical protein